MLRICFKSPQRRRRFLLLFFSSRPRLFSHTRTEIPKKPPNTLSLTSPSKSFSLFALSATLISGAVVSATFLFPSESDRLRQRSQQFYAELEHTLEKSESSINRVFYGIKEKSFAAAMLWKSLQSVLWNQEAASRFDARVSGLLADIISASDGRRSAVVAAGDGAVVDWLLERVGSGRGGTQDEMARALAGLIEDPKVRGDVLGRPHAIPNLLRFIFSFQPHAKKQVKYDSSAGDNVYKGCSMLVAAIMDVITSDCDNLDQNSFQTTLAGNAKMADIAVALQVIEEGGIHLENYKGDNDKDGDKGLCGIGMNMLGGTAVFGVSRANNFLKLDQSVRDIPSSLVLQNNLHSLPVEGNLAPVTAPGLWDDLQREHIAVPFATWALANWAMASSLNRVHIQVLDRDGHAIMTGLMAPERTVKWYASLVARLVLEDQNLPLIALVPQWSSTLLSTISQASLTEDISLASVALSAFLVSLQRSKEAQEVVREKGHDQMRQIVKHSEKHEHVQEALAKALELLSTGDNHLSLEDSQKWSSILLPWVFGKFSTHATRYSATEILSRILEDYGPASVPISQGWLTLLLMQMLSISKMEASKGIATTQIDPSNAVAAAQIVNQLVRAVVYLAGSQSELTTNSAALFALTDFLSLEPFADQFMNKEKDGFLKLGAADIVMATVKGIKILTEICAEDPVCQYKIVDYGVLCLLRRFLLRDDYEKLAASEAYDASRILENQKSVPPGSDGPSISDTNDHFKVRGPPSAHIRKHAAHLLAIVSQLPKVQKAIMEDEIWCKWLEECANGKIPGCNDLKIQSYARATLLHISCPEQADWNSESDDSCDIKGRNWQKRCPRYSDMIFLFNPELPHWKCPGKTDSHCCNINGLSSNSANCPQSCSHSVDPLVDIVFVHGLCGGPFKTWRIADDKTSTMTKSGLVEKIDQEAGKEGTCWPREWLSADFPHARLFSVKYKTNLSQWSGATLPLQEVSLMLLKKLVAAGIGSRPVVFVTHSMGGLVVKQMLYQAKMDNFKELLNNTIGVVFYSCPHFGSRLADMPWGMGYVLRPAPSIEELRSGSPRLSELNDFLRHLHNKGKLKVLSFSETTVTPIVKGYGGWAFRLEIVPMESAYPGFGELVVLEATDHINSCKPVSRTDLSYVETLAFLEKLIGYYK